jgi:hypothetical protein
MYGGDSLPLLPRHDPGQPKIRWNQPATFPTYAWSRRLWTTSKHPRLQSNAAASQRQTAAAIASAKLEETAAAENRVAAQKEEEEAIKHAKTATKDVYSAVGKAIAEVGGGPLSPQAAC